MLWSVTCNSKVKNSTETNVQSTDLNIPPKTREIHLVTLLPQRQTVLSFLRLHQPITISSDTLITRLDSETIEEVKYIVSEQHKN